MEPIECPPQQIKSQGLASKQQPIRGYLLLHNVSKRNNIGTIIRSACAFGLHEICYVTKSAPTRKQKVLDQFHCFGNQGTLNQIDFRPFPSLKAAKEFFRSNNITVIGVEIGASSVPIQKYQFKGHTAFFMGNEGTGLIAQHRQLCDGFVYIPQYTTKTASLNVSVAAGIIFHHFGVWAGFPEAKVEGEKFAELPVQVKPIKTIEYSVPTDEAELNDSELPQCFE